MNQTTQIVREAMRITAKDVIDPKVVRDGVVKKFTLTSKHQASKHCIDGKDRNFVIYFINGVKILKQKSGYDDRLEKGFDGKYSVKDEYVLNGRLYQTRFNLKKTRHVSYPLSKKILTELGVDNTKIIKAF